MDKRFEFLPGESVEAYNKRLGIDIPSFGPLISHAQQSAHHQAQEVLTPTSEVLQQKIEAFEKSFGELENQVRQKAPPSRGYFDTRLYVPFEHAKNNAQYEERNNIARLQSLPPGTERVKLQKKQYFYDFLKPEDKPEGFEVIAAANLGMRTVKFPHNFDPRRPLDLYTMYHEIFHMAHDDFFRRFLPQKQYVEFLSSNKMVIDFEGEAFIEQILIMDTCSDGELRKLSADFKNPANIRAFLQIIKGGKEHWNYAYTLLKLSNKLFSEGGNIFDGKVPTSFWIEIINTYKGCDFYKIQGKELIQVPKI